MSGYDGFGGDCLAAIQGSSMGIASSGTIDRIKTILRRDLKLGQSAVIEDSMPLVGGDLDLDSLDMLLLITSVEKEFGVKIANGSVGREAFRTVESLAEFIDTQR
jgi:acyl carrier protein